MKIPEYPEYFVRKDKHTPFKSREEALAYPKPTPEERIEIDEWMTFVNSSADPDTMPSRMNRWRDRP